MLDAMDPSGPRFADYGCSGSGNMDHSAANKGAPIDEIDKALLARKNCVKCVENEQSSQYEKYSFDSAANVFYSDKLYSSYELNLFNTPSDTMYVDVRHIQ